MTGNERIRRAMRHQSGRPRTGHVPIGRRTLPAQHRYLAGRPLVHQRGFRASPGHAGAALPLRWHSGQPSRPRPRLDARGRAHRDLCRRQPIGPLSQRRPVRCPADDNVQHFRAAPPPRPTIDAVDPDQLYYDDPHCVGGLKYPVLLRHDPVPRRPSAVVARLPLSHDRPRPSRSGPKSFPSTARSFRPGLS